MAAARLQLVRESDRINEIEVITVMSLAQFFF